MRSLEGQSPILLPAQAARYCGVSLSVFRESIAEALTRRRAQDGTRGYAVDEIDSVVFGDDLSAPPLQLPAADDYETAISSAAGALAATTKKRAKLKGWACGIDRAYIEKAIEKQGFRCVLTGIEFDVTPHPTASKRPWAPSVDRIDRSKGYTPQNVRIICAAANLAMNVWDESVLVAVAEGIVAMRGGG